jgi:putative hemolysin
MHYFTLNLFQWLTSTCFEQVYCSSSGGTLLYIHQYVCVMLLCRLAASRIGVEMLNLYFVTLHDESFCCI